MSQQTEECRELSVTNSSFRSSSSLHNIVTSSDPNANRNSLLKDSPETIKENFETTDKCDNTEKNNFIINEEIRSEANLNEVISIYDGKSRSITGSNEIDNLDDNEVDITKSVEDASTNIISFTNKCDDTFHASTCEEITEDKTNQSHSDKSGNTIQDSKLNYTIDESLNNSSLTSNESDTEYNTFFNTLAEEGEEDTLSEQSNDIIEIGEKICSTESELSLDHSYDSSFIDDKEDHNLLSGEEYDLSFDENTQKRKRIIELNSGSDEEVIKIIKPEKKIKNKRKKSRIIKFSDTSEEEIATTSGTEVLQFNNLQTMVINILDDISLDVKSTCNAEIHTPEVDISNNKKETEKILPNSSLNSINDANIEQDDSHYIEKIVKENQVEGNTSQLEEGNLNNENCCKKVVVLENNKVQDICNKNLSNKINNVIKSLFTENKKQVERRLQSATNSGHHMQSITKKQGTQDKTNNKRNKNSHLSVFNKKNTNKNRKKNNFKAKGVTRDTTKLSLLQEAAASVKQKHVFPLQVHNPLEHEWGVQRILVQPSSTSRTHSSINHFQLPKTGSDGNIFKNKFHNKDFRNLMLYDNARVKRVGTQQLLKREIW